MSEIFRPEEEPSCNCGTWIGVALIVVVFVIGFGVGAFVALHW